MSSIMELALQKCNNQKAHMAILESVSIDETIMEDDEEDIVDPDSIPKDVVKKIDAQLDSIITSSDYDDTDLEAMIDEDDTDVEVASTIQECVNNFMFVIPN